MKTIMKKILPCLLVLFSVFAVAGCGKKTTYPSVYPTLGADGDKVFVTVGDLKITNADVYNRLSQSYGVDAIQRMIDKQLLNFELSSEDEAKFQDEMNEIKYGTADVDSLTATEKAEAYEKFEKSMLSSGLYTDDAHKSSDLYFENYYRLEYKRLVKTLEVIKEEIVKHDEEALKEAEEKGTEPSYYFAESDYVKFFNNYFHKSYDVIVVTFDSERQAKDAMALAGIDTSSLLGEWKNPAGVTLTKDQLVSAFKYMYELAYGKQCDGAKTYTYKELTAIASSTSTDGTIASKAVALDANTLAKSYTHGPLAFGGRWFVMLKTGEATTYVDDDDDTVKFEDTVTNFPKKDKNVPSELAQNVKDAIYDELVLSSISGSSTTYTNTINRVMNELRQKAGLEIFAEGIETAYKTAYESTYSSLSITDYDKFFETKGTSATVVAKWNGGEITAKDLFARLSEQYGALMGILFVQQYYVLTSELNTVYDFVNNKVLDQEKYKKYVKSDYTKYKEAFDGGNFESSGYATTYGWDNFLRDYVGLTTEGAIVADYEGSLYNDVIALMRKALYTTDAKDVTVQIMTSAEHARTWALNSPKWAAPVDTLITVVDENEKPTVSVAYTTDDFDSESTLAKDSYYGHFVIECKNAEGKVVRQVTPVAVDELVQEVYKDIYNETFSATVSGVTAYFDNNFDGAADEDLTEDQKALATELVSLVWNLAKTKDAKKTIAYNISAVLREYETALNSSKWTKYKQAGIRLAVMENKTYSNSTAADEVILNAVKANWQRVVDYADKKVDDVVVGKTITDTSLDPGTRYVLNGKVYYVTAYDFADEQVLEVENNFYMFTVTKATKRTAAYYFRTSAGVETSVQKPSPYYYAQYQLASGDREVTINCSSQITTYYVPAMNRIASDNALNKQILTGCKDLIAKVTFTEDNAARVAALTQMIEASLAEIDE